ncbi:SUMF1/EgtB/PvdO family nonheme iron enzyme [Fibrobacterota bacterium]
MRTQKIQPGIVFSLVFLIISASFGQFDGEMVTIPAGNFLKGNDGGSGYGNLSVEGPVEEVFVEEYRISKYEVTRAQYQAFIDDGGYTTEEYWTSAGWNWASPNRRPLYWDAEQTWNGHGMYSETFTQTPDHPVIGCNLYEQQAFCKWAGGMVPTHEQWEKAATWDEAAQEARYWPWGNTWDEEKCNNMWDHSEAGGGYYVYQSAVVGTYPDNVSAYGVYDMVGNAWEMVQDGYLRGGSLDDEVDPSVRSHFWDEGLWHVDPDFQGWTGSDCDAFGIRVVMAPLVTGLRENFGTEGHLGLSIHPGLNAGEKVLSFILPKASQAGINIYNNQGRSVTRIDPAAYPAGPNSVTWNSSRQANGFYFAVLEADGKTYRNKILLHK